MSFWLELQCDARKGPGCHSEAGEFTPGTLCKNLLHSVTKGARWVRQQARRRGWRYDREHGWACPVCLESQKGEPSCLTRTAPRPFPTGSTSARSASRADARAARPRKRSASAGSLPRHGRETGVEENPDDALP